MGCGFAPRCAHVQERCLAARPPLEIANTGQAVACVRHAERPVSDPILTARSITVQFPGSTPETAVADADLVVEKGAAIGLVGESGSGRPRSAGLVGALEPTGGAVEIAGRWWTWVKRNDPLRSAARSFSRILMAPSTRC